MSKVEERETVAAITGAVYESNRCVDEANEIEVELSL